MRISDWSSDVCSSDLLGQLWTAEGVLFLLGALVLGGIALQTQIFQLVGESWQALWFWLALTAPVLVLMARSRLNGYALALMAGWAALALGTGEVGALGRGNRLAVPAALFGPSAEVRTGGEGWGGNGRTR